MGVLCCNGCCFCHWCHCLFPFFGEKEREGSALEGENGSVDLRVCCGVVVIVVVFVVFGVIFFLQNFFVHFCCC